MKILMILVVVGAAVFLIWPMAVKKVEEVMVMERTQQETTRSGMDIAQDLMGERNNEARQADNQSSESRRDMVESPLADGVSEARVSDQLDGLEVNEEVAEIKQVMNQEWTEVAAEEPEVVLTVPFVPQAPRGNWGQPYQDACEEAAVIMVDRFIRGEGLTVDEMDNEILRMIEWQLQKYGSHKDTNSAETAGLAEEYFSLSSRVDYKIGVEDIKNELRAGRPVIVLVDGRKLGNPFYSPPGPDKHALVIKGFDTDGFITNDPGTKRGDGYRYRADKLMGAMIDYDGRQAGTKGKAMVVFD
ncbi:MAG: hypothetical protein UW94_C0010G0007 [Parcubacteria group bacterium GW2011_GWA2_45_14]|nr:MAG: hypothetical protein UW94_C0010G0007 [Parcubacteria group bacterium GW2011_GWA2_45_14]